MAAEDGVEKLFNGIVALFVEAGVQPRRLQVWKQKLQQRGGVLRQHINSTVTHIFAIDLKFLEDRVGRTHLRKLRAMTLKYEWLEDCLKAGHSVAPEPYFLKNLSSSRPTTARDSHPTVLVPDDAQEDGVEKSKRGREEGESEAEEASYKLSKMDDWISKIQMGARVGVVGRKGITTSQSSEKGSVVGSPSQTSPSHGVTGSDSYDPGTSEDQDGQLKQEPLTKYTPPNLNEKITGIFGELKSIYADALGDDRRSFSYYKAISVLEKLPFEITSVDQVKGLPSIGKSLQDQIAEILKTGSSAKLEHFKEDEKVKAISQFGAVWGIGPHTARKLYEKGHRTLEDLMREEALTSAQRTGLKFHSDINTKIPRHEVQEMDAFIQNHAKKIEADIIVVCGGSYRRGKAFSGDMDMIFTHPDGQSHVGFLVKLVQKLKELDFLTEDLRFRLDHDSQETERRVDTYFGLCKYPGRELRHRIDFKVFPIEQYPYGLIAWTGNDVLNRRLRILADSKGFRLDEHGCFPVTVDSEGSKVTQRNRSVPCKTEQEVFDLVGFPWLEPHERNL